MGVRHLFPMLAAMALGASIEVREETPEQREARKALPPDPEDLAYEKRRAVLRGEYGPEAREELLKAERDADQDRRIREIHNRHAPSTAPAAEAIRAETLTRRQINFRRRLPRGHPDRIEG